MGKIPCIFPASREFVGVLLLPYRGTGRVFNEELNLTSQNQESAGAFIAPFKQKPPVTVAPEGGVFVRRCKICYQE
jgi:hypothetical protein